MTMRLDVKRQRKNVGMKLSTKTMELLLVNYKNIHKAYKIDCAEKQRFAKLIAELEKKMSE